MFIRKGKKKKVLEKKIIVAVFHLIGRTYFIWIYNKFGS